MAIVGGGRLEGLLRRPRLVEAAVLLAIAVPALVHKLGRLGTYATGPDGSLYMDVAQHLIAGDGLVTSLSLYHQGYPVLPHATSVQPLWPLSLAAAGSIMPLTTAALALPTVLWFIALALAFWWGRRVAPNVLPAWRGKRAADFTVHGGHVVFSLLALSPDFSSYTSRPYTEGLSFALLFASLVRAPSLFDRRTVMAGVELGLWVALLFYARSQHFVIVLALPCALAWHLLRDRDRRRQTLAFGVASLAAFWLAFLPELLWVGSFVEGSALNAYVRFDMSGEASPLSPVRGLRAGETLLHTVLDRADGVLVAFGPDGYTNVFGWLVYIVPVALLALLAAPRRRWRDLCELADRHALALATAVGAFLLLHLMHKDLGHAWWFGDRHALLGVLFFAFAFFLCARAGGGFAWMAAALFVIAIPHSAYDNLVERTKRPYRPLAFRLEEQARLLALDVTTPGHLIVAMPSNDARQLAWLVPDIGIHAVMEATTFDDLLYMVDELGVDYVVDVGVTSLPAFTDARFEDSFEEVDTFYSPKQPHKKSKKKKKKKKNLPEDLIRIYRPRFLPGAGRGPAE